MIQKHTHSNLTFHFLSSPKRPALYKMASKTKSAGSLLILVVLQAVQSFMDIEELRSVTYGIDIVQEPIAISNVSAFLFTIC